MVYYQSPPRPFLGGADWVADCCDGVLDGVQVCCGVLDGVQDCCGGVLDGVQVCCGGVLDGVLDGVQVCCGGVLDGVHVCCGVLDGVEVCCVGVLDVVEVCCGDVLETAVVEMAVQVCSVVVEAVVGGMKDGVVTVHLVQVVMVSVVRNVETLVIVSMDVLPPLWWVVVETGQLVTVV